MTFTNFDWKQDKEDEQGYYFVLTDTLHHLDYNVVLIKDNGEIMVNGDYINNVPQHIAAAIAPRLDYFMAMNKCRKHGAQNHTAKKPEKKTEAKKETKKTETKKDDKKKPEAKKSEPKKSEKKDDKKAEPKKTEKKDDKKGKK